MHIFVINLERDTERRASISQQLNALGLKYEIIEGIYGASLSDVERLHDYNDCKAKWHQSRALVDAEIGCALSHLKVYRTMVERGIKSALILEDDVILPSSLGLFLKECERIIDAQQPAVWLLSPAEGYEKNLQTISIDKTYHLKAYKTGYYASSYYLTLPAAQSLLKELYPVADFADCWLRMHRYRVVDLFVIDPPLIKQDQTTFGSWTTADIQSTFASNFSVKVSYKIRRLRSLLWGFFYAPYRRIFRPYAGMNFK